MDVAARMSSRASMGVPIGNLSATACSVPTTRLSMMLSVPQADPRPVMPVMVAN